MKVFSYLEPRGHALFESLSRFRVSEAHVLVLLLQVGPVLHHSGNLLTMALFKPLLRFLKFSVQTLRTVYITTNLSYKP